MIAYLYLPPHVPRPLQVMHLIPAGDVDGGFRSLPAAMDDRMAPFIKAGRAAFGVVLAGYVERPRPPGFVRPDVGSIEDHQSRYDEDTPTRTQSEPLFKLLHEPKRMTLYEGGHVPSLEVMMSASSAWLEAQLGPVVRQP